MNNGSLATGGVEGVKTVSVVPDSGRIGVIASSEVEPESLERATESSGGHTATRARLTDD